MGDAAPFEAVSDRTKLINTEFKIGVIQYFCNNPVSFLHFNTRVERVVTRGCRKLSNLTPRPVPPLHYDPQIVLQCPLCCHGTCSPSPSRLQPHTFPLPCSVSRRDHACHPDVPPTT